MEFSQDSFWTAEDEDTRVFCLQMSQDSQFIAAGQGNGVLALRSPTTGRLSYSLPHSSDQFPVTACRFHPKDSKVLLSVSADGWIKEWNTKSAKNTFLMQESNNQIFALTYSREGDKFLTGGKDAKIRVYDNETKKMISDFARNEFDLETARGHCNRIHSIVFHPTNENVFFSGAWDNSLQVWDLRSPIAARAILGPNVSADTLDVYQDYLVAGSWRTEDQLQLFDMRTFQLVTSFQWGKNREESQCKINFTRFHPKEPFIIAGGSGLNEMRSFSIDTFRAVGKILTMPAPILCACFDPSAERIAISTADGRVNFKEMKKCE